MLSYVLDRLYGEGNEEKKPAAAERRVPDDWRELCRRLYVELWHCNHQMISTLDEDGEPLFTTGSTVRDVLLDADAMLNAAPKAERPDHRAVMEQALEALERHPYKLWTGVTEAITALREALK